MNKKSESDAEISIRRLNRDHALRRIQLELTLETTPRDSRYSSQLVEMMKREETLLNESPSLNSTTKELIARVERTLSEETSKYFSKSAALNIKRWISLQGSCEKERDRLRNDILGSTFQLPTGIVDPVPSNQYEAVSVADLDAEAARLDELYNRQWLTFEGFHLKEAFDSQYLRVERDWATHENSLRDDYLSRRRQICGPDADYGDDSRLSTETNNAHDPRWQHPEKQKTLIHTAPVLTPKKDGNFVGSAVKAVRATRTGLSREDTAELERLERQLAIQLEALQRQKESAHRWMNRQKIRLVAQAEAVQEERSVIAETISQERRYFQGLLDAAQRR